MPSSYSKCTTYTLSEYKPLQQHFALSEHDDPFFLSLVEQAYAADLDFNDYLVVHKLPRKLLQRIRKRYPSPTPHELSEVLLL